MLLAVNILDRSTNPNLDNLNPHPRLNTTAAAKPAPPARSAVRCVCCRSVATSVLGVLRRREGWGGREAGEEGRRLGL